MINYTLLNSIRKHALELTDFLLIFYDFIKDLYLIKITNKMNLFEKGNKRA